MMRLESLIIGEGGQMSLLDFLGQIFQSQPSISAKELYRKWTQGPVQILDVRSPREYNRGHIQRSCNLSFEQMGKFKGEKDQAVYVICQSGHRSWHATKTLRDSGYQAIYVKGGLDCWPGKLVK